jgi:hypothetical protein
MPRIKHGMPGIYNAAGITLADGEGSALAVDSAGRVLIAGGTTSGSAAPTSTQISGGVYNSTAPTYLNGQATQNQSDANGNQKVTLATQLAGEDLVAGRMLTEDRNTYAYIATATTTQVKTGPGFLKSITVNTTAAGAISIIDNTSGSTVNIGQLKASVAEGTYEYNVSFATGLRIVTAAASDITVSYR